MAGLGEIEIPGCAEGCEHVWGEVQPEHHPGQVNQTKWSEVDAVAKGQTAGSGQYCQRCGGWRGCLGLEPTVEMFVGHIVLVARELWRVLRDDGTFWLNFGDSYASSGAKGNNNGLGGSTLTTGTTMPRRVEVESLKGRKLPNSIPSGLKPKDLIGIPWRVAFALQADGWYLRSDIIWAKGVSFCPTYSGSCMPESVRDRPTKGHEYVFLLSKEKRYYYDGDAVRESLVYPDKHLESPGTSRVEDARGQTAQETGRTDGYTRPLRNAMNPAGRNLRTVWTINPGNFPGAHYAVFPPALIEPMVKAGTSAKGCCPECGSPWERVTEKEFIPQQDVSLEKGIKGSGTQKPMDASNGWEGFPRGTTAVTTTGWTSTCECDAGDPVPCTVLDPFAGSGTTGEVAIRLGRRVVLVELSEDYCDEHIIPRLESPLQMEMAL